jgi:hypothetical protein
MGMIGKTTRDDEVTHPPAFGVAPREALWRTSVLCWRLTNLLALGEIEGIPIVDVPMFWRKLTEIP